MTDILVLGTADWRQAIATNQHYVVREMARDRFASVTFVESMGLRRPQLSSRDLSRIARRLISRMTTTPTPAGIGRAIPDGVTVRSPVTIPYHYGIPARVNRKLLHSLAAPWLESAQAKTLWTYTPVTYGLEAQADRVVYHCVDLLGEFPGIDRRLIDMNEERLAAAGATAIATSPAVRAHLQDRGFRDIRLWENVADADVIIQSGESSPPRRRRVVFGGNVTPYKVDVPLLLDIANAGYEVVIAGPRAEGGGKVDADLERLEAAGVCFLGMLSLPELAVEMTRSSAGLIPYLENEYTRGVSPLKTYEYLAAGLGVVSIGVPSVRARPGDVWTVSDRASFMRALEQASALPSAAQVESRKLIALDHSWSRRGREIRQLLAEPFARIS